MRFLKSISIPVLLFITAITAAFPTNGQQPWGSWESSEAQTQGPTLFSSNRNVSSGLFAELEEFARLVDIAYCVGVSGVYAPFECASRCDEFPEYQLVDTWNTGPLMSDSCGYIALDHQGERIVVAFRGTYSITNTIMDLATIPQEYVPYPGDPDDDPEDPTADHKSGWSWLSRPWGWPWRSRRQHSCSASPRGSSGLRNVDKPKGPKCNNCTVHMGFWTSWRITRPIVLPHLKNLHDLYPTYKLHLVGHSLGGAVAALAALETDIIGWNPTVTTFGEPRIGNMGLREYLDQVFHLKDNDEEKDPSQRSQNNWKGPGGGRYRRITHINDPVPLLPLSEWGFKMHAGEIYISKKELQPGVSDLQLCFRDEDIECIFGAEAEPPFLPLKPEDGTNEVYLRKIWGLPARYRIWQLFFAHRDYFWRLGLCVPGGDPVNWGRKYDNIAGYGPA